MAAIGLLQAGVSMERLSVLLGHSSIKVTERYYLPWVRARTEQLEADVRRSWQRPTPCTKPQARRILVCEASALELDSGVRNWGQPMPDDSKEPKHPPTRLKLKEIHGGASRSKVAGEISTREGFNPSKPTNLQRPKAMAIPRPPQTSDGLGKGVHPPKPPNVQRPQPVAVPAQPQKPKQ